VRLLIYLFLSFFSSWEDLVLETNYQALKDTLKAQNYQKFGELTKKTLDAGADPFELLNKIIGFAKELTANSWWAGGTEGKSGVTEEKALLLSDLVMIGECLQASTEVLKPALLEASKKSGANAAAGRIVLGTIEGDVHDIGKSLVGTMYEAAGFIVNDVGLDVPVKKFALEAKRTKADVVGVSISMSLCKATIAKLDQELKKAGLRDNLKVITGGQSTSADDVKLYSIDAWGADATDAVNKTNELMRVLKETRTKKA
jgi:methylmalonyl-CoA mutase cobalamin-binding domain/chain